MKKNHAAIVKAIRLAWSSLESHLDAASGSEIERECCNDAVGKPPFHRTCVKEYSEIIKVLADQL